MRPTPAAVALTLLFVATPASAQVRRRFEPTDLELQPAGTLEVDAQLSYTEGETAGRVIVPDLEVSLGLAPNVQLEIDTAYAVEGPPGARFSFDHPAPDNLWLSSKLGLADWGDEAKHRAWALGTQLGPKVPLSPGARGAGYEALWLVGLVVERTHVALNVGGFVDPSPDGMRRRSVALEGGLDYYLDLDAAGRWSLVSEVGVVGYLSGEAHQAHATLGFSWSATPNLDLSLIGLVGLFQAGDRGGVLLGITPRVALWN